MKFVIDIPEKVYEEYISIELIKENGKGEPLMLIPQRQFQRLIQDQPVELVNLPDAKKVPEPAWGCGWK